MSTLDDRNGETYTLCVADTFFGDISGRVGKDDILGDPGHWAKWPVKRRTHKSVNRSQDWHSNGNQVSHWK